MSNSKITSANNAVQKHDQDLEEPTDRAVEVRNVNKKRIRAEIRQEFKRPAASAARDPGEQMFRLLSGELPFPRWNSWAARSECYSRDHPVVVVKRANSTESIAQFPNRKELISSKLGLCRIVRPKWKQLRPSV